MQREVVSRSSVSTGGTKRPKFEGRLLEPDQVVDGRYKVKKLLGTGGQSSVYAAEDLKEEQRRVALKYAKDVALTRIAEFAEEAAFLTRLQEVRGVVRFLDARIAIDELFLVMEYAGDTSLKHALRNPKIAWSAVRGALTDTAQVVQHIHAAGVVHRDLKPSNVLTRNGITVIDFGYAFSQDAPTPAGGKIIGTPAFMSPEQIRGDNSQDRRVDTYALSVTAYFAAFGRLPYTGETPLAMINAILDHTPDMELPFIREDIPAGIREVLEKGLQKKPENRFQTAQEFKTALEQAG